MPQHAPSQKDGQNPGGETGGDEVEPWRGRLPEGSEEKTDKGEHEKNER